MYDRSIKTCPIHIFKNTWRCRRTVKKNLEEVNVTSKDIIVLFDEASFQNEPYTQKSLYKKGTKHKQTVNPYKFKINATGSLAINGNSTITITNSSTAPEIAIALLELRGANTKNKNTVKLLNKIIKELNLTDEEIDKILMKNNENNKVFTQKIIKTIEKYKDDTTSTIARIIGKHCNRESLNNVKKRREIRRKITLNLLEKEDIITKTEKEQRICLILDNYSAHKSAFIIKIALHLNITLIYLPPYSPHLNPIEQIWRQMKREIKHHYLESKEYLQELTIKTYKKTIIGTKVYDNWFKTFISKVW